MSAPDTPQVAAAIDVAAGGVSISINWTQRFAPAADLEGGDLVAHAVREAVAAAPSIASVVQELLGGPDGSPRPSIEHHLEIVAKALGKLTQSEDFRSVVSLKYLAEAQLAVSRALREARQHQGFGPTEGMLDA